MKFNRYILLVAALVAASPAYSAQFCSTTQLSTDPAPISHCETTADANAAYFIAAMAATYFPQGVLVTPASPMATPPVAAVYRAPTTQEIIDAAGHGVWLKEVANINSYLAAQAAAQAVAAAPKVQ